MYFRTFRFYSSCVLNFQSNNGMITRVAYMQLKSLPRVLTNSFNDIQSWNVLIFVNTIQLINLIGTCPMQWHYQQYIAIINVLKPIWPGTQKLSPDSQLHWSRSLICGTCSVRWTNKNISLADISVADQILIVLLHYKVVVVRRRPTEYHHHQPRILTNIS